MAPDLRAIPLEIDSGKPPTDRYKWDEITPTRMSCRYLVNRLFHPYIIVGWICPLSR